MSDQSEARDFVGRAGELAALHAALAHAGAGRGRVVMLAGQPGIGKTRTAAEFASFARAAGALVLRGSCYESEWGQTYGPFAEALNAYVGAVDSADLVDDLGAAAATLSRIIPALGERLTDVAEPAPLPPEEERVRLFDAVTRFLIAIAARQPLVIVFDDLHWADLGTMMLLRHLARFAPQARLLLIGAFRDTDVPVDHPLADMLGALRRESNYERIPLTGLNNDETTQLITGLVANPLAPPLMSAIIAHAEGNPFFVREMVQHLRDENALGDVPLQSFPDLTLSDGIRHLIGRRLKRLSPEANRLLTVASAFAGAFHFEIAMAATGLDQETSLSAIDECLRAHLIEPATHADRYDFTHALLRHALTADLNPSRRVRLHRQLAETMERLYADQSSVHSGEIAYQYYCSRDLPGAARGAAFALAAADRARATYAYAEVAARLRMALALLPDDDPCRASLQARLARAYVDAGDPEAALPVAEEALRLLAEREGHAAAVEFAAACALEMSRTGFLQGGWRLSARALPYVGEHDDRSALLLKIHDVLRREAEGASHVGIFVDTPERQTLSALAERLLVDEGERAFFGNFGFGVPRCRADLHRFRNRPDQFVYHSGEFRRSLPYWEARAHEDETEGRIAPAVEGWARIARCHNALGNFDLARTAFRRARDLARRLPPSAIQAVGVRSARVENMLARDEGWEQMAAGLERMLRTPKAEDQWVLAGVRAAAVLVSARLGRIDLVTELLELLVPVFQRAAGWAFGYTTITCEVATALWWLNRTDHITLIEHCVREKIVGPDLRYPMHDGRLALAYTCALQKRYDEASEWFAQARSVHDEQGARPLRAIADYDEALMYMRRDGAGDRVRAQPLLEAALTQFRAIGMPGWIRRAEHLLATGTEWSPEQKSAVGSGQSAASADTQPRRPNTLPQPDTQHPRPSTCLIRCDGDVWSVSFAGNTQRLKDTRGLHYLAQLFAHPQREFHVSELASLGAAPVSSVAGASGEQPMAADLGDAGEVLDREATVQYQRRLTEVREELGEAEANNDLGGRARLRAELEFLIAELASAGRGKRAASHAERARSAVGKRIRDALNQIAKANPTLGRYLRSTVRTGTFCSYTPDPRLRVECGP